jgi:ABC-type sugar transport system ATPase subunit
MGNITLKKVNKSFGATQVIPGIDLTTASSSSSSAHRVAESRRYSG